MKNLIKSHTLILILALCLSTILSFQALEKNSCFEVDVSKQVKVKAGRCYLLN